MTKLAAGSATDIGLVRAVNQDQFLIADPLYAIADGMGGHAAGEVASQTALDALAEAFASSPAAGGGQEAATNGSARHAAVALRQAAEAANRAVWDAAEARAELRGMGTTLTGLALVAGDGGEQVAVINVGDSRTYRLRDDHFEQITTDHSLVAELVAEGRIRSEDAETHPQRHVLTRALGVYPEVDVDLLLEEPRVGDRYLLCSDGLIREVTDNQVAATLRRLADPGEAARELVAQAKAHGGNDNITVVVVDVVDDEAQAAAVPAESDEAQADEAATGILPAFVPAEAIREAPVEEAPAAAAAAAPAELTRQERRAQRKAAKAARRPRMRIITIRVVAFFILIAAILAGAYAGTDWYAHNTYYVGLDGSQINIYKGRPGGMLWWNPVLVDRTGVTTQDVLADSVPALQGNVLESTLTGAKQYVANLKAQKIADSPTISTVPSTTSTTTSTTTVPKSTKKSSTKSSKTSSTTAAR